MLAVWNFIDITIPTQLDRIGVPVPNELPNSGLTSPAGTVTPVEVAVNDIAIPDWADSDNEGVAYVTLPETLADARDWARMGCGSTIPHSPITGQSRPSYHTETRLADGSLGIVVDPGSIGNLSGDDWVASVSKAASAQGRKTVLKKRERALRVSGVGNGAQECRTDAILPICLRSSTGNMHSGTYETPVVANSTIPGLLGLVSLTEANGLLDLVNKKLYTLGPGDFDLLPVLPPGSECYPLKTAPSGHLLLPCDFHKEYDRQKNNGSLKIEQPNLHLAVTQSQSSSSTQ